MKRCAATMIALVNVQVQYLMKIIQRYGLIALRCNVKAVQAVLIHDILVGSFLQQHLANLDISVKCSVVNSAECFFGCLLVDPRFHDIFILEM